MQSVRNTKRPGNESCACPGGGGATRLPHSGFMAAVEPLVLRTAIASKTEDASEQNSASPSARWGSRHVGRDAPTRPKFTRSCAWIWRPGAAGDATFDHH